MAKITASMVKELRERTGAGMMDCKKALNAVDGDLEAAIKKLREDGLAKAAKKASRAAIEGAIVYKTTPDMKRAILVEVNCETDFVARGDAFQAFANKVGELALEHNTADVATIMELPFEDGKSVDTIRAERIAKLGENIQVTRAFMIEADSGIIGSYIHSGRIGAMVEVSNDDLELARDIAMHVTATNPEALRPEDVPAELVEKEKEIFSAQAAQSGKPAEIIEKMVTGRIQKFLKEVALLSQPFVKNPEQTVDALLKSKGAEVKQFVRCALGEGREVEKKDFAAEVQEQLESSKK